MIIYFWQKQPCSGLRISLLNSSRTDRNPKSQSTFKFDEPLVYFRLRFYVPIHCLRDHSTKFAYYCQLRTNVLEYNLFCPVELYVQLAALGLQADMGNAPAMCVQPLQQGSEILPVYFNVSAYFPPKVGFSLFFPVTVLCSILYSRIKIARSLLDKITDFILAVWTTFLSTLPTFSATIKLFVIVGDCFWEFILFRCEAINTVDLNIQTREELCFVEFLKWLRKSSVIGYESTVVNSASKNKWMSLVGNEQTVFLEEENALIIELPGSWHADRNYVDIKCAEQPLLQRYITGSWHSVVTLLNPNGNLEKKYAQWNNSVMPPFTLMFSDMESDDKRWW